MKQLFDNVDSEDLRSISRGWLIGFWIAAAILIGGVIYDSHFGEGSRMPANFSMVDSRDAVNQAMPGTCVNTRNDTYSNQYVYECSQTRGNYTYIGQARVAYNSTGPNPVYVFD